MQHSSSVPTIGDRLGRRLELPVQYGRRLVVSACRQISLCISPTLGEAFSWMQKPVMINSLKEPTVPRGNHELAKAGMKASFLLLRLDMTFFNGDWIWTHPSQTSLDVTRAFIDS